MDNFGVARTRVDVQHSRSRGRRVSVNRLYRGESDSVLSALVTLRSDLAKAGTPNPDVRLGICLLENVDDGLKFFHFKGRDQILSALGAAMNLLSF